jgi:ABC-type antimicrobial peptide transport system permease subunit
MTATVAPAPRLAGGRVGVLDLGRIAGRGLGARPLRSALTALGIAIGIAAMVAVLGIAESSRATLLAELDRIGSNLLTVAPGQTMFGEDATLPDEATSMIGRIGPVEGVSAVSIVDATVRRTDQIPSGETGGIAVQGTDPSLLQALEGELAAGRFIDEAVEQFPAVVLGALAAERLGITSLEGQPLVWIAERWWAVVGILEPLPLAPEIDRSALVGMEAAREYLDTDASPTTIYVRVADDYLDDVRSVLPATSNPESPEAVNVSRPSDAIEARAAAATAFTTLFLGLGAVALLVGGLGIANVMLMAVLERRNEIGLRRALGATRGHIVGQFLTEAMLLAGAGGVVGAVLGSAVAAAYATSQAWVVALPIAGCVAGVLGAAAVGGIAGLYPAVRAANLAPTDSLRS